MSIELPRRSLWGIAVLLLVVILAIGGATQYKTVKRLREGVGKHAYGKPYGWGAREFRPRNAYVGEIVGLKIFALPDEEMDLPGCQTRYLVRRVTSQGEVEVRMYATDLIDVRDTPPPANIPDNFPSIEFLEIMNR